MAAFGTRLAAAGALFALLAGCAGVPGTPGSASPSATPASPATSAATPAVASGPDATASTIGLATPAPAPTATPGALSAAAQAEFGPCLTTAVTSWSAGPCAILAQTKLAEAGLLAGGTSKRVDARTVNAILNYQRSRGLKAHGTLTEETWLALATGRPELPEVLPADCLTPGVVLCVDQAHRKLSYLEDGVVLKSVPVRLGGYTVHAKTKEWRNFPTANGTWKVYNKNIDPPSETYGYGSMPYSVMFYPDMYVHYSADFAKRGYSGSSHGCVNVGNLDDAKWFYTWTPIGAKVFVF